MTIKISNKNVIKGQRIQPNNSKMKKGQIVKKQTKQQPRHLKKLKNQDLLPYQQGYSIWDQVEKYLKKQKFEYNLEILLEIVLEIQYITTILKRPENRKDLINFYNKTIEKYFQQFKKSITYKNIFEK
jgi:hypothetical protein